jgi:threonine dehydrogenase-like Zn-dependent dehydrogenase
LRQRTKALRLYGVKDLRLEEFDLPDLQENEVLVKVMTDSICMSTYKLAQQGEKHTRAPENLKDSPVIVGHEIAGTIVEVGSKLKDQYFPGQKFTVQPDLKARSIAPGYSFKYFGGDATYAIVPEEVIELGCLIPFEGESFFQASLSEPISCVISGFNTSYHTNSETHDHSIGTKKDGNLAILGACGPMGLGAIDYAVNMEDGPKLVVAIDTSVERIKRAQTVLSEKDAADKGVTLIYHNPNDFSDSINELLQITDNHGYDDVLVYAPITSLVEQGDKLMSYDGCLNFFAGPVDKMFSSNINMYNIHYKRTHVVGNSGSTMDDMKTSINLSSKGVINPTVLITHIGGINVAADTILNLPNIPGGKKLIYTHIDLPLTAISDFEELGKENALFKKLADSCKAHKDCWNANAEKILLNHFNIND